MTELDQRKRQAVDDRIAELEAEVARLQGIEHGLELAASARATCRESAPVDPQEHQRLRDHTQ